MEGQGRELHYVKLEWKDKEYCVKLEWKDKDENYIMLSLSGRTRKRTILCLA